MEEGAVARLEDVDAAAAVVVAAGNGSEEVK